MDEGLTIRRVCPGDQRQWVVMFEAYRDAAGLEPDSDASNRLWAWILDPAIGVQALIAEGGSRLLGFAHFRRFPRPIVADEGLFLDDLFTTPEARGRGVGRALLEHLIADMRLGGFAVLRWTTKPDNGPARKLYDNYGVMADSVTYNVIK